MKPKINYHYSVPFKIRCCFNWKTEPIDLSLYKERIVPGIPHIVEKLNKPYNDRQAVIVVNDGASFMSCLISIQFQKIDNILYVIANFRSQCKINGRPNDSRMLQHIATKIMRQLELKKYKIFVNVGNYHINESLKEHK